MSIRWPLLTWRFPLRLLVAAALAAPRPAGAQESPFDRLNPAAIPKDERFDWQPKELVAVFGNHRWRHWGPARAVAHSPSGGLIASGGDDQVVRVWEIAGGRERFVLRGHKGAVTGVAFSPDAKLLVSVGRDGTVRVWEVASGTELEIIGAHKGGVGAVVFARDGKRFYTGGEDKLVRAWGTASRTEEASYAGHEAPVRCLAVTAQLVAAGAADGNARVWDVSTARERAAFPPPSSGECRTISFTPTGKAVATGGYLDGSMRVWEPLTGKERTALKGSVAAPVSCLAYTPDGKALVYANIGGVLRTLDLQSGKARTESSLGALHHATGMALSPDGKSAATADGHGRVRLWNLTTGVDRTLAHRRDGGYHAAAVSPDGRTLALAADHPDLNIKLWDVAGGKIGATLKTKSITGASHVHFSADGTRLAAGLYSAARVWDLAGVRERHLFKDQVHYDVAFSPDGRLLATCSVAKEAPVTLWDLETGKTRVRLAGHKLNVVAVDFAPRTGLLASASNDGTAKLWDIMAPEKPVTLAGTGGDACLDFAPDGATLAVGSNRNVVQLWDVATKKQRTALKGHTAAVRSVAHDSTGKRLASAGMDGRVILWDPGAGTKAHEWQFPGPVHGVLFTPDGQYVVTVNSNGTVYILKRPS